jgi:hypothetical protein
MTENQGTQILVAKELTTSEYRLAQIQPFFPIDQAGMDYAAGLIRATKDEWKRIDTERTKITKPIRDGLQAVQDLFNPPLKNYIEMERLLKERIVACSQAMQRAQYEATLAAQHAFQQGNLPALAAATLAIASADVSAPQGVSFRVTWDFEIVDYNKIPAQFWVVNETALRAAIVEAKGQIEIPGVRVVRKEGVALR